MKGWKNKYEKNNNKKTCKVIKSSSNTIKEFKDFISKGNVVDLAVGVIIGSAFGKIVTSLVNDILMPFIGVVIGGIDFSSLVLKVGSATILYGIFIQNIVDFLIVSVCIFSFVKIINKFSKNDEPVEEQKKDDQIILLEEIRDILKSNKK